MNLEGFKAAQSLAYRCAVDISKELKDGWSEKQTADLMDTYLRDHGVKTFFHRSFAWFGDRTRFDGVKNYLHFLPSKRILRANDVVILDTAPILNGYPGDIGYTLSLEPNEELAKLKARLLEFREELPKLFASQMTNREIWKKVDDDLKASGYDNCHSKYPFAVLGHQMHRVPLSRLPGVTIPFSLHSYWMLLSRGLLGHLLGPKHESKKEGLWAIEPHLGGRGFGGKFEEILVVEKNAAGYSARWLDDNVPHVTEAFKK